MKTKLRNIATAIGVTAILGSATLIAETWNRSTASIPFDFQIKNQTLPAGKYDVTYTPESKLIVFRNMDSGKSSMVLVFQSASGRVADPKLSFRFDGDRYKLAEVWFNGSGGVYAPLKSRQERDETERGMVATVRLLGK